MFSRPFCSVLLVALSLSMGWGVRGNWGHEYGAMIPGALSAMAVAAVSGREDWRRRIAWFAFFGAIGWSFGGSMSYGRVLGFTQTDSPPDVAYGFAMIFLIGFLWGAMGGAATAMAACMERERLEEFFPPLLCVFAAWGLWDYVVAPHVLSEELRGRLDWYDTDWTGVLLLMAAVLAYCAWRRRITEAASLMLEMAAGWWAGFLLLVVVFGLRMTPPRSDNWAGCLGMSLAMFWWFQRRGLAQVSFVALATAFFAGLGFATGKWINLIGMWTGVQTNWWSVMEQTFGFIAGVGVALAMGRLAVLETPAAEPSTGGWREPFSVGFLLLGVTWLNISKNVATAWLPTKALPAVWYGLPAQWWFHLAYALLGAVVILLIVCHRRAPLAMAPATWLGKAQILYLVFLWWIVLGNLSRYLPFPPVRMVTEGVIHINACLATLLMATVTETGGLARPAAWIRFQWLGVASLLALGVYILTALAFFDGPFGGAQFRFQR